MASALATPSPFLKIIGIVIVIISIFVLYKVFTGGEEAPAPAVTGPAGPKPAKGEVPDTVEETLRTFVSRVASAESKLDKLSEDNSKIVGQSQAIQSNLEQQLEKKYTDLQAESDKKTKDLIQELKQNVEEAKVQSKEAKQAAAEAAAIKQAVAPTVPIPGAQPGQPGVPTPAGPAPEETQIIWIKPGGEQQVQQVGTPPPTVVAPPGGLSPIPPVEEEEIEEEPAKSGAAPSPGTPTTAEKAPTGTRPVHTIPANATLLDARTMTALIGRVPFQGSVVDPMRFKLIVGTENLATNGITIPRISGIVASGTAVGDWTLVCVRGTIDSMTFTFEDGTISTVSGNMGTLSDPFGVPCIPGEKISNASQFLLGRLLAAGATSISEALGKAQITETPGGNGGEKATNVSGSSGQYAALQATKGMGKELTEYFKERQSQTFDVVFVRSGAPLAIHIDREIAIDYNPNGRKVFYEETSSTQTAARLD